MAIRLGTQNWINPAPFAAAAEMTVEAGRAEGQMYANIGQGINKAVSGYEAKKERDRNRQDILNQQGLSNARADRAEARATAESKMSMLKGNIAAKQINYEMMKARYDAEGTPEAEAALRQAEAGVREATNWFAVGMGTHAGALQQPTGMDVPDYVGARDGMVVNGKTMAQMSDAELDDFMAKSQAGQVDVSYRGGATGDMGQGVGTPAPQQSMTQRQGEMEAALDLSTSAGLMSLAERQVERAIQIQGKAKDVKPEAATLRAKAEFNKARAQAMLAAEDDARTEAAKVEGDKRDAAAANESLRALGLRPEFAPDLPGPAAAAMMKQYEAGAVEQAKLPARTALSDRKFGQTMFKQDDAQAAAAEKLDKQQENALARMEYGWAKKASYAADARAAGVPGKQIDDIEFQIEAKMKRERMIRMEARDAIANGDMTKADTLRREALDLRAEADTLTDELRSLSQNRGSAGGDITKKSTEARQAAVDAAFDALPKEQQTDEEMMKMLKAAGLVR